MEITPRQFEIIEAAGKILTSSGVSGLTIKNLSIHSRPSFILITKLFSMKSGQFLRVSGLVII